MCGITGQISFSKSHPIQERDILRMNAAIRHRGPDDGGTYVNPHKTVGLGHQRLSIIDLSPAGHQPMSNEDGSVWIVFNGEIYNFHQLQEDLERRGHTFRSHSDTETIVHLWEEYGVDCLQHLRGMFAFAIWDESKQVLFLARDRLGKKPLKYYIGNETLLFASELKAILTNSSVTKEVDWEAIDHYLTFQYVPHPATGFRQMQKLPPAHYLLVDCSGARAIVSAPIRYWTLHAAEQPNYSEQEWTTRIIDTLEDSVRMRMIADVPLGAFLSGGVDSSAIVALMARNSSTPVRTFSIGFREESHNELEYARRVSRQYATNHTEFIVEPNAMDVLPKLVYHYEEPYADSSALPTYYVSKLTRDHVTVALNGDGGDENFGGYPWYNVHAFTHRYYTHMPRWIQRRIHRSAHSLFNVWKTPWTYNVDRYAGGIGESSKERYLRYLAYFLPEEKKRLYSPPLRELLAYTNSLKLLLERFQETDARDPIQQAISTDINSYLADDLLVKVDIASMAVALESRSPLLDHVFMEMAASIPSSLKIRHGVNKYIFKKALEGIVPRENLYRKKMGFGVPINQWFRGPLVAYLQNTLLDPGSFCRRYFSGESVEELIREHQQTRVNHAPRLWALLTLELWWKTFF